jgi:hypothetical protein
MEASDLTPEDEDTGIHNSDEVPGALHDSVLMEASDLTPEDEDTGIQNFSFNFPSN